MLCPSLCGIWGIPTISSRVCVSLIPLTARYIGFPYPKGKEPATHHKPVVPSPTLIPPIRETADIQDRRAEPFVGAALKTVCSVTGPTPNTSLDHPIFASFVRQKDTATDSGSHLKSIQITNREGTA